MNITGYKKKKRSMREILNLELKKGKGRQYISKIDRLENAIHDCSKRIKVLQEKYRKRKRD